MSSSPPSIENTEQASATPAPVNKKPLFYIESSSLLPRQYYTICNPAVRTMFLSIDHWLGSYNDLATQHQVIQDSPTPSRTDLDNLELLCTQVDEKLSDVGEDLDGMKVVGKRDIVQVS
jgi:hypothetical protein